MNNYNEIHNELAFPDFKLAYNLNAEVVTMIIGSLRYKIADNICRIITHPEGLNRVKRTNEANIYRTTNRL